MFMGNSNQEPGLRRILKYKNETSECAQDSFLMLDNSRNTEETRGFDEDRFLILDT